MKLFLLLLISSLTISAQDPSTWSKIQSDIFDINCTMCHYEGSSFAVQSGLILTSDLAYQSLIDVEPKNTPAFDDGLLRVSSDGGQPGLEKSFLWEKINAEDVEHYYEDHANYGGLMPLGLPSLTKGEISFIKEWILAGAPDAGLVADISLFEDTSRYQQIEFKELVPPTTGFQLHAGPTDVWSADKWDREFLMYESFKTDNPTYVTGFEISMREGSHHYIVYNYVKGQTTPQEGVYRDMRNSTGLPNGINQLALSFLFPEKFFVGTQTPYYRYSFPEGIALELPPNEGFDHNMHFANRSGSVIPGEAYLNIYTTELENVKYVAKNGNFSNYNFQLPPQKRTTIIKDFYFDAQAHLIQIWSHAHEKMEEFSIYRKGGPKDGELIYWTNDWEHPPYLLLDPPMTFEKGEGVTLETRYNNQSNETVGFGPLSTDEMQFMFFIYFTGEITDVEEKAIPTEFELAQNYPNPFNPTTTIKFNIPVTADHVSPAGRHQSARTILRIYNALGEQVTELLNQELESGFHSVEFDASNLASGLYLYRITSGDFVRTKKMLLLK
ncbi:MAG: T9SS type A sorting domain-containing protein [Melioribacteraceae bacterium]|nr:T9SS type A sorting domain-containing protein [Melioribacteraceae bacterium]MCF8263050.1 T9SS type A sorting domain-containing protein [Melioribacteraceae bacterium]MCF8431258.1 T9SS type A sorting domain-containing protein [Melioribacteraceae bacterium]